MLCIMATFAVVAPMCARIMHLGEEQISNSAAKSKLLASLQASSRLPLSTCSCSCSCSTPPLSSRADERCPAAGSSRHYGEGDDGSRGADCAAAAPPDRCCRCTSPPHMVPAFFAHILCFNPRPAACAASHCPPPAAWVVLVAFLPRAGLLVLRAYINFQNNVSPGKRPFSMCLGLSRPHLLIRLSLRHVRYLPNSATSRSHMVVS